MLEVSDLHASYGPVPILKGVNFTVVDQEILSILGRNGVGKTTLMRALTGLLKPEKGKIVLDGRNISGFPPHRIARSRVAYVPQGRGIFPKLTVRENLLVGTRAQGSRHAVIPEEIFGFFPILKDRLSQMGATLSGGEQQMLAIGRALSGKPRLLLLDEPSEGIQPNLVQQFASLIPNIVAQTTMSVLLVEQNLDLAIKVSHRCLVMEKGTIVYQGSPREFEQDTVIKEYLAI